MSTNCRDKSACEENFPCEVKYEFELGQKHKASVKCKANETCVKLKVKLTCTGSPPHEAKQSFEVKLFQKCQASVKMRGWRKTRSNITTLRESFQTRS